MIHRPGLYPVCAVEQPDGSYLVTWTDPDRHAPKYIDFDEVQALQYRNDKARRPRFPVIHLEDAA